MASKTYRCYLRFETPAAFREDAIPRTGKVHYIVATNPDSARAYMERVFMPKEIKKGEEHLGTVAAAQKEDKALRALGAKELPLDFG